MKLRLLSLIMFSVISISMFGKTIDAIYVSSSNPKLTPVCYMLNSRPTITYTADKVIVSIECKEILVIPFEECERISVEYGTYQNTGFEDIVTTSKEEEFPKKLLINNKIVILHNGIMYNVNGTLFK